MKIFSAALSDIGRVRSGNEDSFLADRKHGLFVVADGMGGCNAGEVASRLAVELFQQEIDSCSEEEISFAGYASRNAASLARAVAAANRGVHDASLSRDEWAGMGTTIAAVKLDGYRLTVAHVGDSRVYLVRSPSIIRLTEDHSYVQEQQTAGILDSSQAFHHPLKHILTRALGPLPHVEPEIAETDLIGGDRLILCSDGLTTVVSDEEISAIVSNGADAAAICAELVDLANERGGADNITVISVVLAAENYVQRLIRCFRR